MKQAPTITFMIVQNATSIFAIPVQQTWNMHFLTCTIFTKDAGKIGRDVFGNMQKMEQGEGNMDNQVTDVHIKKKFKHVYRHYALYFMRNVKIM